MSDPLQALVAARTFIVESNLAGLGVNRIVAVIDAALKTNRSSTRPAVADDMTDQSSKIIRADMTRQDGPLPMILTCPTCGERHVDKGTFATKPHHTHACQHCGMVWRPAVIDTVGVQFLPGFKDEPNADAAPATYQVIADLTEQVRRLLANSR